MKLILLTLLMEVRPEILTPAFIQTMTGTTWHSGCPVPPSNLRMLTLSYWDYQGKAREGRLIVNREVADEVAAMFKELYAHKFPIEKMQPIEQYGGSDDQSMAANNTSAFNCRDKTGLPGQFSNHSWGRAIDINPLTNPYVKGTKVLPPAGRAYLNREREYTGGIQKGGFVVELFRKHGWEWGGNWKDRQDYQHFEKPQRRP